MTGVVEIIREPPAGTLGHAFVVACLNDCCAKSREILVIRNAEEAEEEVEEGTEGEAEEE